MATTTTTQDVKVETVENETVNEDETAMNEDKTTEDETPINETALNGEETPIIDGTEEETPAEEDETTNPTATTTTSSTSVTIHPFKERLDTFKMQEWQLKPSLPQSPSSIDDTATVTLVR